VLQRQAQPGETIAAGITLTDVNGEVVSLATLTATRVAIPLVRYYGCMPCRDYLLQLEAARPRLEAHGVRVVGVGGAADYQARHLMANGVGYPLLLDPTHELYNALDLHHIKWWKLLSPATWVKYLRAARRARQGRITAHPLQAPGFVILGPGGVIELLHRGETLGDYPPIETVLAASRVAA